MNKNLFAKKARKSWFLRYVTTSIILFLVPCIFVCSYAYSVFATRIQTQMYERNSEHVANLEENVVELTQDMDRISYRIFQNQSLAPRTLKKDVLSYSVAISTLGNYIIANHIFKDVLLFYPAENLIITSETAIKLWQVPFMPGIENISPELFEADSLKENWHRFIFLGKDYLYVAGVPPQVATSQMFCLFLVDGSMFNQMIELPGCQTVLIDDIDCASVAPIDENSLIPESEMLEIYSGLDNSDMQKYTYNSQKLVVTKRYSARSRYGVLAIMDSGALTRPLTTAVIYFFVFTVFVGLLAIGAIYVAAKRNYTPLKILKEEAELVLGKNHPRLNEFDVVSTAIRHLQDLNIGLNNFNIKSRRQIRAYIMNELLSGEIKNIASLNEKLAALDLQLPDATLYMVLMASADEEQTEIFEICFAEFSSGKLQSGSYVGFGCRLSANRALYLFSCTDYAIFKDMLAEQADEWAVHVTEPLALSLSAPLKSPEYARKAFEQTLYLVSRPDAYTAGLLCFASSMFALEEKAVGGKAELIHTLIAYMLDNYCDNGFSVQQMADEFELPISTLSNYFKQKTGKTLIDYITFLKIEKAKELLVNSDIPLQELVFQIGYIDVSNFIRKFSRIVGQTPGSYRAEQRKKSGIKDT